MSVAVLIPCRNEARTVVSVIEDFRRELPDARLYVCDNGSSDDTAARAAGAGAIVVSEPRPGKGFAVAQLLAVADAAYYVLVDGDATYPAASVHQLLTPLQRGEAETVIGVRCATDPGVWRPMHRLGNRLLTETFNLRHGGHLHDLLSGYRSWTRAFRDGAPPPSDGFEVEVQLTRAALRHGRVQEVRVPFHARPTDASPSKLNTFQDGARVLRAILTRRGA